MQDIIRLLPDAIANQIAAGEVVQRPASAVKELLENALDAKATQIQLIVREAGKSLIQVVDNGIGMSETDARMSFERHATSKISKSEDLFTLRTMGFRGEALASIAAVAQVELRSRRQADELGVLIKIEGSEIKTHEATQCAAGTSIQVKNLFFNVPARRNFLKSNPVELKHIIDEFQRVALANPQISFSMYHADEEVYMLPAGKLARRITDLFGKNYEQQLASCVEHTELLNVSGYIGKPSFAKKTKTEQFFFVNGRYIRSGYLHHALMTAYAGMLEENSHPFYVIFLEIDPKHIDINVHPTKTEIKFDDERSVYAVLSAAARKAINQYNLAPSIDFEADSGNNFLQQFGTSTPFERPLQHKEPLAGFAKLGANSLPKSNLGNWEKLYEGLEKKTIESSPAPLASQSNLLANNESNSAVASQQADHYLQLHKQYILAQVRSGLMLVHQQGAYERICYEKNIKASSGEKSLPSQTLLFPETINFNAADFQLVIDMEAEAKQLGFDYALLAGNSIMVNAIPADFLNENVKEAFEGILEQYKNFKSQLKLDKKESLARAAAKRQAQKYQKVLSQPEMQWLIDHLFACQNPQISPGGEPILKIVELEKLAQLMS